jgi:transcriptional regulator with XRE-family HTH domain
VTKSQDLSFGDRLRELRKAKGLTQKGLAAKVDLDFTYLSKVETGSAEPPREDKIRKLAAALNADAEELVLLAGKVPKELRRVVTENSAAPTLLRALRDKEFTVEELEALMAKLKEQKE